MRSLSFSGEEDIHRTLTAFFPLADRPVNGIDWLASVFNESIEELTTCAAVVGEQRRVKILAEILFNPPDDVDSCFDCGRCSCR